MILDPFPEMANESQLVTSFGDRRKEKLVSPFREVTFQPDSCNTFHVSPIRSSLDRPRLVALVGPVRIGLKGH